LKARVDKQLFKPEALAKNARRARRVDRGQNLEVFHRYTPANECSAQSSYIPISLVIDTNVFLVYTPGKGRISVIRPQNARPVI
jgi:hypothetical protein